MSFDHNTASDLHDRAHALAGLANQLIRLSDNKEGIRTTGDKEGNRASGMMYALALIADDLERIAWQLVEATPIDYAMPQGKDGEA